MNILMVSSFLPYPLFSGGHIRLYNLIKNLKKDGFEITLICEKRDHQSESDIKKVAEICSKVLTVDRMKQWTIKNILVSNFSLRSFLTTGHNHPEMKKLISDELNSKRYDLIHVETFYVYQNLPKTNLPVVLAEHNIEHFVYRRNAFKANIILKIPLYLDSLKMKREEKSFWEKASKLIAVSEADKREMKREDAVVVANGVDIEKFNLKRKFNDKNEERRLLFIGDFKWIQNRDAVSWILKEVWPKVKEEAEKNNLNVKFWVVGKRIPQSLKDMGDLNVVFDENAPVETEKIYNASDILISPIRIGGGTNFKILESMASGLPVITTKLGNEGIDGIPNKDIVIAETADEYLKNIISLLNNQTLYKNISENGRNYIRNNFDWLSITKKLEEVYRKALK